MSPKVAGMESKAKSRSVAPMAPITSSMGVIMRLPLILVNSLSPWYLSEAGRNRRASRTITLSASSLLLLDAVSSPWSCWPATSSRARPKR